MSVTRYPYDIFAASFLGVVIDSDDHVVRSTDALSDVPDVVAYTDELDAGGTTADQIGTAFRRGDYFVLVLTNRTESVPAERAAALAADLTRLTAANLPAGDTGPYHLPGPTSKFTGLLLTAAIVTAAAGGSAAVARLRARRVRRRWTGGALPAPAVVDGSAPGAAIALDPAAERLRRHGAVVAGGQLCAVNIGIVALAGDFAWTGVAVAALVPRRRAGHDPMVAAPRAQLVGLEGATAGARAPPAGRRDRRCDRLGRPRIRDRIRAEGHPLPRLSDVAGAAQVVRPARRRAAHGRHPVHRRWVPGRRHRWLAVPDRAGAESTPAPKRVLERDHRRSALYLRSFDDDSLPLPTIASARRPLFEMFSLRGADPFEESVAWELNSYGPVVAVARPGRSLASLGAAREHLSDETWRDQVATRMEEAGIIAVATGETDGLAWELGQVVSGGHLAKTFFVFPPLAPDALDRRWAHTTASLAEHGLAVGPLPVPPSLIHTVRVDTDGTASVTYATRRDEATYRTAVDYALDPGTSIREPRSAPPRRGAIGDHVDARLPCRPLGDPGEIGPDAPRGDRPVVAAACDEQHTATSTIATDPPFDTTLVTTTVGNDRHDDTGHRQRSRRLPRRRRLRPPRRRPTTLPVVTSTVTGTAVAGNSGGVGPDQTDSFSEAVRNEDGTCSGWAGPGQW